jgi:hypothetical protein
MKKKQHLLRLSPLVIDMLLKMLLLMVADVSMAARKETSKFYLSDLMRKFETEQPKSGRSGGHNFLRLNVTTGEQTPLNPNNSNKDRVVFDVQSEAEDEAAFLTSISSNSYCRPNYRTYRIQLGNECAPMDYRLVECSGYCNSQSMVWKNQEELRVVACCSIKRMVERKTRLYCAKPVDMSLIESDLYKSSKDEELHELFRNSFSLSAWTRLSGAEKNSNIYTGYYTVNMFYNVTCSCQLL